MKEKAFLKSWWWQVLACFLILLMASLFWKIFLVGYVYERWNIAIGLGGAVYPALFAVPVLGGAAAWQCMIRKRLKTATTMKTMILTVGLPSIITIGCLFIFCPTDAGVWLPRLLFGK